MMEDPASEIVQMTDAVALSILAAASAAHPHEACGLLLAAGDGAIIAHTESENVAADRERAFEIDPRHIAQWQRHARDRGLRIAGCWHSHPDGSTAPSERDLEGAGWPDFLWAIAGGGRLALWRPGPHGFRRLELVRSTGDA